jgi:hypothetical protein
MVSINNPLSRPEYQWEDKEYNTKYPKLNGLFTMLEKSNSMNQGRIYSLKDRLLKLPKHIQVDFLNKIEPTIESNDTETLIRVIRSFNEHSSCLNSKKNGCVVSRKSRKSKSRKSRKSRKN